MPYFWGLIDIGVFLFEYLFVTTIAQTGLPHAHSLFRYTKPTTFEKCCGSVTGFFSMGPCVACLLLTDAIKITLSLVFVGLWCYLVCKYFLWRYQVELQHFYIHLTNTAKVVIGINGVGIALMILLQLYQHTWIYSLDNLLKAEKNDIDYLRTWQYLVGAPVIEEIILKVIMITVIFRRTKDILFSIFAANTSFAALHLINALQHASKYYVVFQAVAALELGLFFSTRYILSQNLFESITLHVLNNATAIWIPINITQEQLYTYLPSIVLSMLVYAVVIIRDLVYVREMFKTRANTAAAETDVASIKQE
jgi:membrane protease YdiL (CAAX protease family)